MRRRNARALLPMAGLMLAAAGNVHASGFALNEMSAASVGNAHAGAAAVAEDLGTIYYNPAGLARMSGTQFMAAVSGVRPSTKFRNAGSLSATGALASGSNGGDAGGWSPVPAIYYATDVSPRLRFGIGLQAPFGLKTEYAPDWVGRYQALISEMKTYHINPSLSWRLNDALALGAGISAQYVDVELSRAIDFGSICIATLGAGACAPSGFLPQARDGTATVQGNDWGFGYTLGMLWTPDASTRIGIAYHSRIRHKLRGQASFNKPAGLPAPLAGAPSFSDGAANAAVSLPESLSLAVYRDLDPRWAVMGDVTWMRWSRFDELRVRFANGAADSVTPERWRNTVRIAAAVHYRVAESWKLRAGVAWDPAPLESPFRTPRIPDADRTWLGLGAQYRPTPQDTWDFGYAHLFIKDGAIDKTETGAGTLRGAYESKVDIVSLQYSRAF